MNPSAYQFYDTAIVIDGYHKNKQGSLTVMWDNNVVTVSFWNYNCLAETSRILIVKTIDTGIYDTNYNWNASNTAVEVNATGEQWTDFYQLMKYDRKSEDNNLCIFDKKHTNVG